MTKNKTQQKQTQPTDKQKQEETKDQSQQQGDTQDQSKSTDGQSQQTQQQQGTDGQAGNSKEPQSPVTEPKVDVQKNSMPNMGLKRNVDPSKASASVRTAVERVEKDLKEIEDGTIQGSDPLASAYRRIYRTVMSAINRFDNDDMAIALDAIVNLFDEHSDGAMSITRRYAYVPAMQLTATQAAHYEDMMTFLCAKAEGLSADELKDNYDISRLTNEIQQTERFMIWAKVK